MFKISPLVLLFVITLFVPTVYAEDEASALQKTQDCLKNQNCESMKSNAGRSADQKALEAVGGDAAKKQAIYNISADEIMPVLAQQTNGDPEKMQLLLLKAQTDPEGFMNSLPPETQAKIKNIAASVEKK
jgi:hypothetical protein